MIKRKCMIYNEDMTDVVIGDIVSIEYESFSPYSSPTINVTIQQSRCMDIPMIEKDIILLEENRDLLEKQCNELKDMVQKTKDKLEELQCSGVICICDTKKDFDWSYE